MTKEWPERIYFWEVGTGGVRFSDEPENQDAIEYVRADTVPKWQDISSAPRERIGPEIWQNHGLDILACDRHGYVMVVRWEWHQNGKTGNWKDVTGHVVPRPTHWMPLPTPPKDGE